MGLLIGTPGGWAGDWQITPRVGIDNTYTDNVSVETRGNENSDLITTVSPGLSVRGTGARLTLNFDAALQRLNFLKDSDGDQFRQQFTGSGTAELFEDTVFIDAQASVDRQTIDAAAPVAGNDVNSSTNQTTVRTYNISPYFRHHFANWADSIARYRFSGSSTGGNALADSQTVSSSFSLTSGRNFSRFPWSINTNNEVTQGAADSPSLKRRTIDGDFRYVLTPAVTLILGLGHERITDQSLNQAPDGMIWDAGFLYQPSSRTSIEATYGDRFDSQTISFNMNHQITTRSTISASFSEEIRTSQQLQSDLLLFLGVDAQGVLIDTRTGLPFNPGDFGFSLVENSFRTERLNVVFTTTRDRMSLSLQAFVEQRDTDATGVSQMLMGFTLSGNRRLTRRSTTTFSLNYENNDFGTTDGRKDDSMSVATSLAYRILTGVDATVGYNLTWRNSNTEGNGLLANSVTMGLRKEF